MDLLEVQLFGALAILIEGLIGGSVPFLLAKSSRIKLILALGNAFSGGIFVGAAFIHMFPDAIEMFGEVVVSDFPWAMMTAVLTIYMLFYIEYVFLDPADHEMLHSHGDEEGVSQTKEVTEHDAEKESLLGGNDDHHDHHHHHSQSSLSTTSVSSVWVMLVAMSMHALITGVATGVNTDQDSVTALLLAVLAHKWCEVMAVSIPISQCKTLSKAMQYGMVAFLSCMTPLGVCIGVAARLSISDSALDWTQAVATSMSAGTFTYVAFAEVMIPEFSREYDHRDKTLSRNIRYGRWLMALGGTLFMAWVATLE
ncbi:zinc/iron permease [Kipferlia bialata]|uniref:Zinc/iron permease n=1 Tax=Kipferlia bialata TaxID=797122 RepID=A0A9K3CR04_9EUKA|nr:zinc/iron permease [Kipferlia bialata]|eukprot:g2654.t1